MKIIYKILIGFFIVSLVSLSPKVEAQNYDLYGYFTYTVTKYTEWPADYMTGDFIIGILGDSPAEKSLRQLTEKVEIRGNPMKLVKFENVSEIEKCNILFIPKDRSDEFDDILEKINNTSVLLITEKEGLTAKGSCVNFITQNEKLVFQINKVAFEKQKLIVSKELTKFSVAN